MFVPSSQEAMKGEMSGLLVSADVALIARAETLPTVPWLKRISPALPGSAIVVELSNVYLNADAPVAATAVTFAASAKTTSAAVSTKSAAVSVASEAVKTAFAVAITAWAVAVDALEAAEVAELAAAEAEVVALAASTNKNHFAASVFVLIGTEPLDVCAVIQM